jgi:undecaprenyl-diphosphatase
MFWNKAERIDMNRFSPNTNWNDARRFRAGVLVVIGILLWFSFGLLAAGVDDRRLFREWDAALKESWHEHAQRHETWRNVALVLTSLGSWEAMTILTVVVAIVLIGLRERRQALVWVATIWLNAKCVDGLKQIYDRPRPEFLEPIVLEASRSFPSGHAAGMAAATGLLAYLLIRGTRRLGWVLLGPLFGVALLVGWTRIYLGAHWLSDVIAGWVFGWGSVAFGMAAAEAWRAH